MKTFNDLQFNPTLFGKQAREDFDNGYGVSVVIGRWSYGGDKGLYKLSVFKDGHLCYDTPITSDVKGHLTPKQVTELMKQVQELSKNS